MTDEKARELAIYQALKAIDEVAAAVQAHLIEDHGADAADVAAGRVANHSLTLLRQARSRLTQGLQAVNADQLALSDDVPLRGV
jgi:hypothetical protein